MDLEGKGGEGGREMSEPAIGIIGGSGLYEMEGLEEVEELRVETPFGAPSDALIGGRLRGRRLYFLARHGRGHRLMPTELNHRANIWALRSRNVRWIISVTAVGSLQEQYAPRDIVVPDQLIDRTSRRAEHTFFGEGIVGHVAFAEPYSAELGEILHRTASELNLNAHRGGTYVNMDGPAFSTRAESELHRRLGFDLIGMTNSGEAKLAREAEIALATLAMVTDYDCWKADEEGVHVEMVIGHLMANAESARRIVAEAVTSIPDRADWEAHRALEHAIITDRSLWPAGTVKKLEPILGRFVQTEGAA